MNKIKLSAIVAMAENRIIGRDNTLIWHLPEDLKHFKKTTMGKPMVMGRKSFESLPGILPGRAHVIITRTPPADDADKNLYYAPSIKEAVTKAERLATGQGQDEIFITGGGEIYKQTLSMLDRLYLTLVHQDYEGDTSFPKINWDDWDIVDTEEHEEDVAKKRPAFTIFTLDKIKS